MRRWVLPIILIVVFIIIGCNLYKGKSPLLFSGTLEITEHVLGAKTAGRVASLFVDEGDRIKAGAVIALFDRYDQAKKDYERLQASYQTGGVGLQEVEHARLAMEDQEVIAPIDGVVLVKAAQIGEMIPAGSGIVVLGDEQDRWVRIFVPEGVINQLRIDQPASISFDGIKDKAKGYVKYISPKAEFTPRNVQTPEERMTQVFAVKVAVREGHAHPGVNADVILE